MEKTYYIYHIPGVKIGCSTNPTNRVNSQGYFDFEILEEHTDIMIASQREIDLQLEYGYGRDNKPYWMTINAPTLNGRRNGGIRNVESGHLASISSNAGKIGGRLGGKINGKKNVESGHWEIVRHLGNEINQERIICEYCGTIANRLNHGRWHGPKCKLKP
jgi:hypothetical protein